MEKKEKQSVFMTLNAINVNEHVEQKDTGKRKLSYLSWAWAWAKVKENYPDASYTIYENTLPSGYVVNYFTDGMTAWVKTGVTIEGLEHIEYLPVMDAKNNSIPYERITSWDVNKAIQRSLTKAAARHGLGLYIYAGEDLPEEEAKEEKNAMEKRIEQACAAMRAVKSREEFENIWRVWANKVPHDQGSAFMAAALEMAQQFPKPQ